MAENIGEFRSTVMAGLDNGIGGNVGVIKLRKGAYSKTSSRKRRRREPGSQQSKRCDYDDRG